MAKKVILVSLVFLILFSVGVSGYIFQDVVEFIEQFIDGQMGVLGVFNIVEIYSSIEDSDVQQILDDLEINNKRLSFFLERVNVASGDEKLIAIGVKNTRDSELQFEIVLHKETCVVLIVL